MTDTETPKPETPEPKPHIALPAGFWRNAALIVPVVLVNVVAFSGQYQWASAHLDGHWVMPWVFAAAIESIGVYLAWEAHAALMAGDAAFRLRVASYAVAGLVGGLNYTVHSGPGYAPTAQAVAYGLMSASSPWLWSIRSRSMHRDTLRALGLVDARSVRFAVVRWVLYPRLTYAVWRAAVWAGEVNPEVAVATYNFGARNFQSPPGNESFVAPSPTEVQPASPKPARRADNINPAWVRQAAREIAAGNPPSLRTVKARHSIGEPKARAILTAAREQADRATVVAIGGRT